MAERGVFKKASFALFNLRAGCFAFRVPGRMLHRHAQPGARGRKDTPLTYRCHAHYRPWLLEACLQEQSFGCCQTRKMPKVGWILANYCLH